MTDTVKTTQLELWGDETELQTKFAAIKEFERWSASLNRPRWIAPALGPDDRCAGRATVMWPRWWSVIRGSACW